MSFDPTNPIGRRLGPVEVIAALGQGGMGAVFRARDGLGREVALKLALDPGQRASCRERFQREGEIAASLDHPGVVRVFTAGEEHGIPFLVCELVAGARTLDAACAGLPHAARAGLVLQAARAVGHAHARGVVHRDLKPSNVLVDAEGRVRVIDFGVAYDGRYLDRLTETGTAVGTPCYMSPEQLRGKRAEVTPACDVWALGVVLYELLTGSLPYVADNVVGLVEAITQRPVTPPRELDPSIPPGLQAVCLKALAGRRQERYPHGDALADDLHRALEGRATEATDGSASRRVPLLAAGVGAFCLAFGVLLWLRPGRAPDPAAAPDGGDPGGATARAVDAPVPGARQVLEAVETGALERAEALLSAAPDLDGDLEEVRRAAFRHGTELLRDPQAGTRALAPVFRIGELLRRSLGPPPDVTFPLAVMERAWAFERDAERRLDDVRTVELLEGLARMGVALPQVEARRQYFVHSRVMGRGRSEDFARRAARLGVALLRMQVYLNGSFYALAGSAGPPPCPADADPVERYVQLRILLAIEGYPDRREAPAWAERRAGLLQETGRLLENAGPEAFGPRGYAAALAGLARAQALLESPVDPSLHERALSLCPDDPEFLWGAALDRLGEARRLSLAGERSRAEERIREAQAGARRAQAESARQGHAALEAFAPLEHGVLALQVTCAGLLGDRAAGEAHIEALPEAPWINRDSLQGELRRQLLEALQVRERVLREGE